MFKNHIILQPIEAHLFGATSAQDLIAPHLPVLSNSGNAPTFIVLDLSAATSVTASYLRASVFWALLCGQAHVDEQSVTSSLDKWAIRPIPLFPVVSGCSDEIAGEVDDFFRSRDLPILFAKKLGASGVANAHLLGALDSFLASTFHLLIAAGEATAKQLADSSSEQISVNGWSNRLFDLFRLRLVTRRRDGKFWVYSSITEALSSWD